MISGRAIIYPLEEVELGAYMFGYVFSKMMHHIQQPLRMIVITSKMPLLIQLNHQKHINQIPVYKMHMKMRSFIGSDSVKIKVQ